MWTTSPAFAEALAAPIRRWHTRLDVLYAGEVVPIVGQTITGYVDLDDVAVRRAGRITLADLDGSLTPATAADLLAPKGTELRPWKGLTLADGTIEWVPLGVLGIGEPTVTGTEGGGSSLELPCTDRVDAVRARRFSAPWRVVAGTPTHLAIGDVVRSRLDVDARYTITGHTVPELVFDALSDPWDAVRTMAAADDLTAHFDALGTLTVAPDVPVETGVVYRPGPGSLMLGTDRTISAEHTYSGVRVRVEHPDADPIDVLLWDTDSKSPTYHLGPFGERPFGFSSPAIRTLEQAQSVAATILRRVTRMRQTATLRTIGHPGHDIGDVVEVTDPATRTTGRWVVVGARVPLRPGPITLKLEEAL